MSLPLRYRCGTTGGWCHARTLNVSRSGLLLAPAHALREGRRVNLVLNLPSSNAFPPPRVRCTAVVVRQGDGARAALAIERYRFLRPEDRG